MYWALRQLGEDEKLRPLFLQVVKDCSKAA